MKGEVVLVIDMLNDFALEGALLEAPANRVAPLDPADGDLALRQMEQVLGVRVERQAVQ